MTTSGPCIDISAAEPPFEAGKGFPRPELLAPAGDWECARAAVENGADAIYFGLERFNARMRAHNFTVADLPKLMEFLHGRGVRGYVTFNTLVFANELEEAEQHLRSIIAAGVDAAIVQDVGICRLIRRLSPDFPIHASTQMTITSAAGIEFAKDLGCQLVVLARECSIKDIERIQSSLKSVEQTSAPDPSSRIPGLASHVANSTPLPLEVFVHGALCVAYSGQCLTSEALGGRSANRGECAQACRMPYELVSDGQIVPLGDKKYLLSPQDLAGLEVLPELTRVGVASLKIEGRLKSPEYVANITRIYRQALDKISSAALSRSTDHTLTDRLAGSSPRTPPSSSDHYAMEMAFSRGLSTGWFRGINNQELVHARFGKKRGVYLGTVMRVKGNGVLLQLEAPVKLGDGVVFDAGHPDVKEEGGRIYEIRSTANDLSKIANATLPEEVLLVFGHEVVDFSRVHPGDRLWKTSDPELDRRLRQSFAGDQPHFQRSLHFEVNGCPGQPLTVTARDEFGHVAQAASNSTLVDARTQPLTTERLRDQLGRLGATPFKLGELLNQLGHAVMLPMSELNRLRRELVADLQAQRARPKRWTLLTPERARTFTSAQTAEIGNAGILPATPAASPELIVLVRTMPQLETALRCGIQTLYCEFENPKHYREAVQAVHCSKSCGDASRNIFVAPPRIFKLGEEWILQQVRSSKADGYLIRNYDHLKYFSDDRCVGDFSLNIANALAAEYFKNHFHLERLTASYDLNMAQLEALLATAPSTCFEITIHQHIPMFHMEHCVFCAFLSKGTDYTNCGRPCDKHQVALRDRVGAQHPLKADAGCRNTVFNALAQTGAESVDRLLALGARYFRIEFLNETPEQVIRTITMYRQLLRREITGSQLWRELKLLNQLGVTRGTQR